MHTKCTERHGTLCVANRFALPLFSLTLGHTVKNKTMVEMRFLLMEHFTRGGVNHDVSGRVHVSHHRKEPIIPADLFFVLGMIRVHFMGNKMQNVFNAWK